MCVCVCAHVFIFLLFIKFITHAYHMHVHLSVPLFGAPKAKHSCLGEPLLWNSQRRAVIQWGCARDTFPWNGSNLKLKKTYQRSPAWNGKKKEGQGCMIVCVCSFLLVTGGLSHGFFASPFCHVDFAPNPQCRWPLLMSVDQLRRGGKYEEAMSSTIADREPRPRAEPKRCPLPLLAKIEPFANSNSFIFWKTMAWRGSVLLATPWLSS